MSTVSSEEVTQAPRVSRSERGRRRQWKVLSVGFPRSPPLLQGSRGSPACGQAVDRAAGRAPRTWAVWPEGPCCLLPTVLQPCQPHTETSFCRPRRSGMESGSRRGPNGATRVLPLGHRPEVHGTQSELCLSLRIGPPESSPTSLIKWGQAAALPGSRESKCNKIKNV